MKTTTILLTLAAAALSSAATGKELTVSVRNVRNAEGNILTMLRIPRQQPLYAETPARAGSVTVRFGDVAGDEAEVWLIHDRNGNYRMDTDAEGRPAEGYARCTQPLSEELNTVEIDLTYPTDQ